MPLASSFLSTASASAFFASSAAFASAFAFFASRDATFFSAFFKADFFSFKSIFKVSMLAVMDAILVFREANSLLLLRNLGCVVGMGSFGTVFADFCSGHR